MAYAREHIAHYIGGGVCTNQENNGGWSDTTYPVDSRINSVIITPIIPGMVPAVLVIPIKVPAYRGAIFKMHNAPTHTWASVSYYWIYTSQGSL